MKNKYLKSIAFIAFSFFAVVGVNAQSAPFLQFGGKPAQDTAAKVKVNLWEQITKTPWVVQVGLDVIDDDDLKLSEFKFWSGINYYPMRFSVEKRLVGKFSKFGIQIAGSSESLRPHNFWSTDINLKYSILTSSIWDKKFFDPYVLIGGGNTYRDIPHGSRYPALAGKKPDAGKDNSGNFNIGAGANFWIFPNAAIYIQGVAKFNLLEKKFQGSNYLQYSAGFAFKIGKKDAPKLAPVVPFVSTPEAIDAAKYLQQILNK
jgi:hypothetical protein